MKTPRYGNLHTVKRTLGYKQWGNVPLLVNCLAVIPNPNSPFPLVRCSDIRTGAIYDNVQSIQMAYPSANSMGLLFFANGDMALPLFLPLGY